MLFDPPESWRKVRLEDVCDRITVGHVGSMADKYVPEGVPFLRSQNITPFKICFDGIKHIDEAFNIKLKKSSLRPGDVAVVRTGYPGTAAVIPPSLPVSNCADLVVITPSKELDSWFLSCLFNSIWGKGAVAGNLVGVAQQHFNVSAAKNLTIYLPPLVTQRRVSSILSAYDDLIENNTRRIEILEEMARRLYEEWFVHFRLPGHEEVSFKDSELGRIPEGWEVKGLYDIAEVTYGHPFKAKQFNDQGEGLGAVRIRDIRDGQVKTYTTEEGKPKHIIENGDILVGMDGQFHMGKWAGGKAWLVQRVARFRPTQPMSRYLLFLTIERPIKHLEETIVGTTVAHLSAKDLKAMKVVVPDEATLKMMADALEPMYELEMRLKRKNVNLRAQRDLLLPKLVSGEIDVSDIPMPEDKEVEAA